MINTEEFALRLHKILEHHDLTASAFAQKIGVGRSSISHILSGRNKPSLEFVLKTLEVFPDIDLYWLIKGKGGFPKKDTPQKFTKNTGQKEAKTQHKRSINSLDKKNIDKIIVLYKDGSFEDFYKP